VSNPTARELLEVALAAAQAGADVLVDGVGRPKQVELKSDRTSIVTALDLAAQAEVTKVIMSRYPDHAILGEEGTAAGATGAGITWLVDPLDGTSNYAHGIPFACTSVAARDAGGVAAGAVVDPFRREVFSAARGEGAWLGDDALRVSETERLSAALACTGVQADDPAAVAAFADRVRRLGTACRGVRCLGSPALCLAYVAAGRIDAFVERDSTYAWDLGAGALMIEEAGGRIQDLDGGPLNLGPGIANVLATNGLIHAELTGLLR
jgi:myo-inositol-1(or 4)-monophosphatase